jgi:class 3 adenylate cyclase
MADRFDDRRPVVSAGAPASVAATAGAGTAGAQAGTELPHDLTLDTPLVDRAFAFVDLCGFTAFMAQHGEQHARRELHGFREHVREIATRRGVRVAKWLGDGAMIVGTTVGPTIAAATELTARYRSEPMALRGGVAHGKVLLFDGDDYLGRPANLASRLCRVARRGEVLTVGYPAASLPEWIQVVGMRDLSLHGLGRFRRVQCLALVEGLDLGMLERRPLAYPVALDT